MNLIREFEMQRMKESETVKEYSDRLLSIVNKVRMLGKNLPDSRVVEKILVTLSEKLNALQAQEQRRLMREEGTVEGALQAKLQSNAGSRYKKGKGKKNHAGNNQVAANNGGGNNSSSNKGDKFPSCQHCRRKNHPHFKCWRKPDMRCRKCNKLGHAEIICKSKDNQQETEAQVANQQEEEQLFVATCFMGSSSSDSWLIDSGCTNHMTNDETLFRELDRSATSKVKIGNGDYIAVKGKGTVAFETYSGTKTISDVLYVPEIDQNLLSVGQLLQKGFKVIFENQKCLIKDVKDQDCIQSKDEGKKLHIGSNG
ncbi:PREDICTED: uncharacterized protein LOC109210495 [Nicotiana attenuata]|uniref:uncharacterized protein LOC109210495 n=1 Tax=Nicotiana attenuata TaxID=49451 RepID=UPI000905988E|nr:PREDICTED: uncharacterized protein LOC109210495 [Nicotiana attenuata]